jgi:hypothetical protein
MKVNDMGRCGGEEKYLQEIWWGNLKERVCLEDLGRDGRIILRWLCNKYNRRAWTGLIWLIKGANGSIL